MKVSMLTSITEEAPMGESVSLRGSLHNDRTEVRAQGQTALCVVSHLTVASKHCCSCIHEHKYLHSSHINESVNANIHYREAVQRSTNG